MKKECAHKQNSNFSAYCVFPLVHVYTGSTSDASGAVYKPFRCTYTDNLLNKLRRTSEI